MYQICRQFEKKVQWKRPSILIGLHSTSKMSPFLIRPGLRRATFPPGQCHQLKEPGSDFPVIANQSADWCGNPFPLQRPDFEHVTKEKTDCHVAALLAMTEVDGTLMLKLMTLPPGEGIGAAAPEKLFRKPEPLPKIQERMMT